MDHLEERMKAVKALFQKYRLFCKQLAFHYVQDDAAAEDIVQNVFLEILEKNFLAEVNNNPQAYLGMHCKSRALNYIRDRQRRKEAISNFSEITEIHETPYYGESFQIKRNLFHAIESLPRQRQQAFTLVYMEDKSRLEAAEKMGISENSVKTHLKHAVKQLRQALNIFR